MTFSWISEITISHCAENDMERRLIQLGGSCGFYVGGAMPDMTEILAGSP